MSELGFGMIIGAWTVTGLAAINSGNPLWGAVGITTGIGLSALFRWVKP